MFHTLSIGRPVETCPHWHPRQRRYDLRPQWPGPVDGVVETPDQTKIHDLLRVSGAARSRAADSTTDSAAAEPEKPPSDSEEDPQNGVWGQVFGVRSERDFGIAFELQGSGWALGYDRQIKDHFVAGVFGGLTDSNGAQGQYRTQTQKVDTLSFGAYGSYTQNHWYIDCVFDHGDYDIAARRLVTAGSTTFASAADYEATDNSLYLEAGWLYEPRSLLFMQPLTSMEYHHFDQDAIVETGGVGGILTADPIEFNTFQTGIGMRVFKVMSAGDETLFLPELKVRWMHNFNHEGVPVRQTVGSTQSVLDFQSEDLSDENVIHAQVGLSAYSTGDFEFNGNYFAEFGQNTKIQAATFTVACRF